VTDINLAPRSNLIQFTTLNTRTKKISYGDFGAKWKLGSKKEKRISFRIKRAPPEQAKTSIHSRTHSSLTIAILLEKFTENF
jgi:hypothetical protein